MKYEEIQISAEWGHIAVKAWGNRSNEAVILLHGWHLNANSFDGLISYLPKTYYYICPDLPGHGRSSPFFKSLPTYFSNYLVVMLLVMQHFQRDRYVLIGHSLGAVICTNFAQLYPERVKKLFLIDHCYLLPLEPKEHLWTIRKSCDLSVNSERTQKKYTFEQALQRLTAQEYYGRIDENCAKKLLQRMLEKVGNDQYVIINDPNLQYVNFPAVDRQYIVNLMAKRPISQECVLIKATNALKREPIEDILHILPQVKVIELQGDHFIHQQKPDVVAPYITDFLLRSTHKL